MEMENKGFQGQPADRTALDLIHAGALSFAIEYRFVGKEQGPSVHVFGPRNGIDEEILRFDCFDKVPSSRDARCRHPVAILRKLVLQYRLNHDQYAAELLS